MRPTSRLTSIAGLVVGIALFAAACSAAATDTPAATVAGATDTAMAAVMTPAATDTTAPGTSAMDTAAADGTVTIGLTDDATLGAYLTGQGGMTLYVFKSDKADTSTCSGTCATNWPTLTSTAGASIIPPSAATAAFGTINRPDGTIQVPVLLRRRLGRGRHQRTGQEQPVVRGTGERLARRSICDRYAQRLLRVPRLSAASTPLQNPPAPNRRVRLAPTCGRCPPSRSGPAILAVHK